MIQIRNVPEEMHAELLRICDPEAVDRQAFADQDAMIARYGGRDAAAMIGARAATPPPDTVAVAGLGTRP